MYTTRPRTGSRHLLARIAVAAAVTALPLGFAAPALAAPPTAVDRPWQQDCDHNGRYGWQDNRGRSEWNDCDRDRGYWQWWDGDRYDRGEWRWQHHDNNNYPQRAPAPWWWFPGMFGSS
jgi:hypothetical protein